jgi:hypothetical protein
MHPGPHGGDPTPSSFVSKSRLGGFLHAPLCGLASSGPGSPNRDYSRMSLETTWPRFAQGASAPVWSYGEVHALADSHQHMVTQAPLKS